MLPSFSGEGVDDAQALDELLHRAPEVLLEEELGVVKARAHDALVAEETTVAETLGSALETMTNSRVSLPWASKIGK